MLNCLIACPECERPGEAHLVECTVTPELLAELEVDSAEDIEHEELYRRQEFDDGAFIDGVCSDCGSDYIRDDEGNIID